MRRRLVVVFMLIAAALAIALVTTTVVAMDDCGALGFIRVCGRPSPLLAGSGYVCRFTPTSSATLKSC
jgi:hypothetical protein